MKKTRKVILVILVVLFITPLLFFAISNVYAQGPVCTSGGLIPCGRGCDDPSTTGWNEKDACTPCSLILMGQLVIEFLVKISAVLALIAITFSGLLYMFAAGSSGAIEKAKSMMKYTLLGFALVFIAWAVIDSILMTMGYIDPMGGSWYVINC